MAEGMKPLHIAESVPIVLSVWSLTSPFTRRHPAKDALLAADRQRVAQIYREWLPATVPTP